MLMIALKRIFISGKRKQISFIFGIGLMKNYLTELQNG